jgi:plasmid stabilization system protein ParE
VTNYVVTAEADDDLESIWSYIASDKPNAADYWIRKLFTEFERLENSPAIGHRREDVTSHDLLFWPVGNYLIVYRGRDPIEIVAVTHGARDIPTFLNQRLTEH